MARGRLLLVCAVVAGGLGLVTPLGARADCAAPYELQGIAGDARPGGRLEVTGFLFIDGSRCDDTPEPGCGGDKSRPGKPSRDVVLRLEQDGRTYDLGTADATNRAGDIRWEVTLPPQLKPGPATLSTSKLPSMGVPLTISVR